MGNAASAVGNCPTWASEPADNVNARTQVGNRIRLKVAPVIGAFGNSIPAGTEALAFTLAIVMSDAASVAGCAAPACIVFNDCFVEDAFGDPNGERISNAQVGQHVTWQGGGTISCPQATPVQKKTWGSVKALYR
jgi:hypothetical protein